MPEVVCEGCSKTFFVFASRIGRRKFCSRECRYRKSEAERFWAKVEKGEGCWLWRGGLQDQGYGIFNFRGQSELAHRVAFFLIYGRWPEPCGLHSCDNPPCVRPEHIFEGTRCDNNKDRAQKGRTRANIGATMRRYPERQARGERQGSAKLSAVIVKEIKTRASAGESQRDLAAAYGVSKTCVGEILRGHTWCHV
ncbi:MAG: hypothetical protein C4551_10260 [Bacillota bacterium]|jgi:DNA-binding XRE family transcriptional regulator|nr:MAG: hypothetical protein C4551_10260 [Bacillota bacterium]